LQMYRNLRLYSKLRTSNTLIYFVLCAEVSKFVRDFISDIPISNKISEQKLRFFYIILLKNIHLFNHKKKLILKKKLSDENNLLSFQKKKLNFCILLIYLTTNQKKFALSNYFCFKQKCQSRNCFTNRIINISNHLFSNIQEYSIDSSSQLNKTKGNKKLLKQAQLKCNDNNNKKLHLSKFYQHYNESDLTN
ncbi:hypothetical protein RFI_26694, partial [Reticulomyxa filosa]